MTTPRITTHAIGNREWWLEVHHNGTHRFGPYKKATQSNWLKEHIEANAKRHGWDRALELGPADETAQAPAEGT